MAAELKLPLVLHGRGESVFVSMLDGMRRHLDREHRIHWHCINPKTDLITIASFLGDFPHSFLGFNYSSFSEADTSLQNTFNAWLLDRQNVLERMALETDFLEAIVSPCRAVQSSERDNFHRSLFGKRSSTKEIQHSTNDRSVKRQYSHLVWHRLRILRDKYLLFLLGH